MPVEYTITISMTQKTVMYQSWRHLLFVHWEVPIEQVQKTLPDGLIVDTFDGRAYIGLVPFTMQDIRPVGLPALSPLSNFHECNVRTYVKDKNGENPGVWFYSLDAANRIAVKIARRLFHLPYFHAEMSLKKAENGTIDYSTRRYKNGAFCTASWTPEKTIFSAQPNTLDYFLCERYRLYSYASHKNQLYTGLVHHTPYPLQEVSSLEFSQNLTDAAGFALTVPPATIHYSYGVDVRISPLVKLNKS